VPHLYLHVPFCARRCSYCDFSIAVRKRVPAEEYVVLIQRELELVRAADPGPLLFEPRGTLKDFLGSSLGRRPSVAAPGLTHPGESRSQTSSRSTASTYSAAGTRFRTAMEKSQYEQRRAQKGTWR